MKYFLSLLLCSISLIILGQKKELDHSVYDSWENIKDVIYQPHGKFISFTVNPQEGDAKLVVYNNQNKNNIIIPRAYQGQFTENGQFLIAKIKPLFADIRKAKIEKKKADEMPKDSLVIVNISTLDILKIPSVKSFQIPKSNNGQIAYLTDKKGDINLTGTELVWYNLNTHNSRKFNNIAQYLISPTGENLVMYQVKAQNNSTNILLANLLDTNTKVLNSNFHITTGFVWDEKGKTLGYLLERDSLDKALQKNYTLNIYKNEYDSAISVVSRNHKALPSNYTIGGDKSLKFSKSGTILQFGIHPILPIKDTTLPEFERAGLDIWHYNDPALQSVQLKNLDADLKATEPVLYNIINDSVVYLGKINDKNIIYTNEGDGSFAYSIQDSTYEIPSQWQGFSLKDIYAINTHTAKKSLLQKAWKGNLVKSSFDGNRLIIYDEIVKKYFALDARSQTKVAIAKDVKYPLFDEDNDVPDDPNAYGVAKWMDNNEAIIIYDRYDLWLVDANGIKPSVALTNGRLTKTVFRFIETNEERQALSNNDTILLKGFNEIDKTESISILTLGNKQHSIINKLPMHITSIEKAKYANEMVVMQEDEKNAPNLFTYQISKNLQNPTAIFNINEQQKNYNWLKNELVSWKAYTGKKAEGILYYPENFNPQKKYPMIVYFYERNNQTLHNYLAPAPTGSRLNIPFFVSRGYIVFVPDIWYQKGYPGQGAYDYILSGTRAMIQKGFIDSTKIGLQGQSWGGYQIAYLITKTNLYAAAWAGAPVVNMTSAYGGIRWGPGIVRQFQYEKTQSRIGATLWERPDLYIKNSPLFSLPSVTTPLVIMNNDADDAVPWYQGIEYFTAMRRLHKKIWLLVYNNEAHNLLERKNKKDIQIREQQFFDHYLMGAPMPNWMSKGLPAIMKGRDWGLN